MHHQRQKGNFGFWDDARLGTENNHLSEAGWVLLDDDRDGDDDSDRLYGGNDHRSRSLGDSDGEHHGVPSGATSSADMRDMTTCRATQRVQDSRLVIARDKGFAALLMGRKEESLCHRNGLTSSELESGACQRFRLTSVT